MKKLSQWLDEFVENGADPAEVEDWPSQGGGGSSSEDSTGTYLNDGSVYTLSVDFKALKKYITDNNIDLSAEITENYNKAELMFGLSVSGMEGSDYLDSDVQSIYFGTDSGEILVYCTHVTGNPFIVGEFQEHTTIMDVINMACEKDGGVHEYGEVYFDNDALVCLMGFRQGSEEGLPVCRSISRADWEKIFIMTPANQGE